MKLDKMNQSHDFVLLTNHKRSPMFEVVSSQLFYGHMVCVFVEGDMEYVYEIV